ncbi:DUF1467 family protein [Sulfitobacter sp. AS59]|jgi:predicted secreted protein|uniref:DUF1467 family protein n=1 Tax=Sulfitobacter sp. AS59 TaxID=3135784 RepID=UPI0030FAE832
MGVTSALVLFAVIWSMIFMIALPIRVKTQGDLGEIVEGTHAGAPEHHHLKKKAWWTTGITLALWTFTVWFILSGIVTVADIEYWLHGDLTPIGGTDG